MASVVQVGLVAPAGRGVPAVSEAEAVRVVRVAWVALAVQVGSVAPAGRRPRRRWWCQAVLVVRVASVVQVGWWRRQAGPAAGRRRPTFAGAQRPGGAFGDMSGGRQAGQYGQRGAQSRSAAQQRVGRRRCVAVVEAAPAVAVEASAAVARGGGRR